MQAASSAISYAKASGISIPSGASVDPVPGPPVPGLPPVAPIGKRTPQRCSDDGVAGIVLHVSLLC